MAYNSISEIPDFIKQRIYLDEHTDAMFELSEACNLDNRACQALLLIQTDILLKKIPVLDFQKIVKERLKSDDNLSKRLAIELWGNYFLLFQDFLGKVDDLIVQNGGDLQKYQERARKLLSPHRQLQEFIKSYLYDFGLENSGDAGRDELIDIILDRALEKIDEKGLIERLQALIAKAKVETKAEDIADTIENLLVAGDISKKWAEYYANLADNVLAGRPFVEEEEKKDEGEAKEEPVILEKSEERPRKELSALEIQERLNNLSLETDLTKKIIGAKKLLDGLNVYAMKKSQIYDTISQAEILAEHFGKSQNVLEKRAMEDELRGEVDKIMMDIKEVAAEPAGVDEIRQAIGDLK